MRQAFVQTLVEMGERDPTIVLLTGDLGYKVLEPFRDQFADRFFNVGVAEQNMVGLATGLAASGFKPFAYSIATFASMRAYEFFRNGPVLHQLPVRLVGVGGGLDYGHNGATHYALEDIGLMRVQPDLTVIAPADSDQVETALRATADLPSPIYFRLGKEEVAVPGLDGGFELGRAQFIGSGDDLAIITYGGIAFEAVAAAKLLEEEGTSATVVIVASLAPAPVDDLADVLSRVPLAVTLEAHYTDGGVGSLVAEIMAERGIACCLVRCGMTAMPRGTTGDARYLYDRHRLTGRHVAASALAALRRGRVAGQRVPRHTP